VHSSVCTLCVLVSTCLLISACVQIPKSKEVEKTVGQDPSDTTKPKTNRRSKLDPYDGLSPHIVTDIEIGRFGGILRLGAAGDPKTFNPLLANESSSSLVLGPMFANCWAYHNGRQEEEPGLCESYERSDDGLTYTFTLRAGLRWSDGHPLTAEDFEFSYRVIIDPRFPNSDSDLFRQGTDELGRHRYPEFKKIDARRFQFQLHQREVLFQYTVGSFVVIPKHVWQSNFQKGDLSKVMGVNINLEKLVGSGPFIVRKYEPGKRVFMERNTYYWKVDPKGNHLPYLDAVEFLISPDQSATLARFEAAETHMHDVRARDYERLKRAEKATRSLVVDLGPSFNTNYLMFNLGDRKTGIENANGDPDFKLAWFRNKNFRAAISHAIDRNAIVRNVLGGRGQPLWSYISPANRKWYPEGVKRYAFDLVLAAKTLSDSGFTKLEGRLRGPTGNPVEFNILTPAENDTRIGMLNLIKRDLLRLGIVAHIKPTPFNDIISALRQTRAFDAVLLGWGTAIPPDPSFSRNVIMSSGQDHYWRPEQEKAATDWEGRMDELMKKNASTVDYATRKTYSDELFRIFSEFQPQIQLVVTYDAAVARNNIGNFQPSALGPKAHWNIEALFFRDRETPSR
jgi:peptide/nickel transport system substrate-binding protein